MSDLISVVVPIYNVEAYLSECVESIQRQTYQNIEIILVDDGSPDHCPEMCDQFAKKDSRIKVIHKKNGGLSDARNAGIEVANGDYLLFVDSDDYISNVMIERMHCRIIQDQSDMAICNFEYVDEKGESLGINKLVENVTVAEEQFWREMNQTHEVYGNNYVFCVVAWNKLYARKLFKGVRYDVGKCHEDEFILHKLVSKCEKISLLSEKLYCYRQRAQSIMNSKYTMKRMDCAEAMIQRSIYLHQRGWQDLAEWTLTRSIVYIMKGYAMPEHREKAWKKRINELHKAFRAAYIQIATGKGASWRFRVNSLSFYLSPFIRKHIIKIKSGIKSTGARIFSAMKKMVDG